MYEHLVDFRAAAMACGEVYYGDGSLQHEKVKAAYKIYRNAVAGTLLSDLEGNPVDLGVTIVGRLALRADDGGWVPADENFPSIDKIMQENLGIMDEDAGDSGSILSAGLWSLLANDAWILGGIHARTEFHFASPLRWKNLWDEGRSRMTVTAREVIGITAFGYEIRRPVPKLEAVAVCTDESQAAAASLPDYKAVVAKHLTSATFKNFFNTIPQTARQ